MSGNYDDSGSMSSACHDLTVSADFSEPGIASPIIPLWFICSGCFAVAGLFSSAVSGGLPVLLFPAWCPVFGMLCGLLSADIIGGLFPAGIIGRRFRHGSACIAAHDRKIIQ